MASKPIRETSRILKAEGFEISHEGLRRAIKSGRISLEPDGGLDPKKVRRQLQANTHPGRGKGGNGGATETNGTAPASGYHTARTFRETFRAKMEELEYRKALGEMVEVSDVRRVVFARARKARDMLLSMGPRLAPVVAGLGGDTKACLHAIEEEVERVLDELAQPDRDVW